MTFEEILDQAIAMLQRRGRLTYSTLKRQFQLDDAALEDLKNEFIYGQRLAVDEEERVLVWRGEPLSAPPPTTAPLPTRASEPARVPLAYTPAHLAEKILTFRSALEGERKQVTVLFADLKGSMELLAERDPEEARQLLDPVLERMIEAVHRYEGTVNQVMGDGIMALFGAPIAHEDHAVRACYAALRMQETVTRYGDEMQRSHGIPVQIRVGLNAGAVVVRAIDSSLHMDYTAVGQTTHLAARMEQMAKPGSVLTTRETLRLAEGFVQVKALGPVAVKGLAAPVEVFELVGAASTRTRLQAFAARGLTRLSGGRRNLRPCARPWSVLAPAMARLRRSLGSPGWARPAWSTSSPAPITPATGSCSKAARSPTARPPPTSPCATCSRSTSRLTTATTGAKSVRSSLASPSPWMRPSGRPCRPSSRSWTCRSKIGIGRASIPRNAASALSRPSRACCCARARCSRCSWSSRTCTGSTPRPTQSSTA